MTEIYRTTIKAAGEHANDFARDGLFVTFGEDAPKALRDYCFIVSVEGVNGLITAGQTLLIDGHPYTITAVGNVAQKNLEALGHVTINVDGSPSPKLEGAIHITADDVAPEPRVGSELVIEAA